jgi:hypothetical protein
LATTVALAGIAGVMTFAVALTAPFARVRSRTIATGLTLVCSWSPTWVLGVAVGSAGLSYGAVASRGLLAGSGPAALAAGTGAAMLVAFLAAFLLRTRARNGA